jgi:phage minor structural protein
LLLERVLEGRKDFTSEIQPTLNTNLLLKNNQISKTKQHNFINWFWHDWYSIPDGFFRYFINNKGENVNNNLDYLDALNGLTEHGNVYFVPDYDKYLENYSYVNHDVADMYNGWLTQETPLSYTTANKTIVLLFKAVDADYQGTRVLFSQRESTLPGVNKGYHIAFTDRKLYVRFYDSSENILLDTYVYDKEIELNKWYSIVLSHNSNTMDFYVDGIKTKIQTFTGTVDYARKYGLGNMIDGGYQFQGYLKSFGIYDEYMIDKDIALFYNTFRKMYSLYPDENKTSLLFSQLKNSVNWYYAFDETLPPPYHLFWGVTSGDAPILRYLFESEYVELYIFYDSGVGGEFDLFVDNTYIDTIDTSTDDGLKIAYSSGNLGAGIHSIRCDVTSDYVFFFGIKATKISSKKNILNINYLQPDINSEKWVVEKSFPRLLPRYELDGLDEIKLLFYLLNDGSDSNLNVQNGGGNIATETLTERKVKNNNDIEDFTHWVLDFYNGGQYYTSTPPSSDGGTSRTIVIWCRPRSWDVTGGYTHTLFTQRIASADRGYHIGIDYDANVYVLVYDSSGSQLIYDWHPLVLQETEWYCIIFTHTSTGYQLYVNKQIGADYTFSGTPAYTNNIKFGATYTANNWQFWGSLSTFFMFSQHWSQTNVNDYYNNAKEFKQMLPDNFFVKTSNPITLSNFKIETTSSYKNIWLNKGEWYELTFTGIQATFYGSYTVNGGSGVVYHDNEAVGAINQFNSTPDYDVVYDFIADNYGEHTIKIENNSALEGQFLYISKIVFNYGNNQIHDYSGKNNNCEMELYSNGSNDIVNGLNDFAFSFLEDTYIKTTQNIYQTLGNKFYLGFWFRPNERHVSNTTMYIWDTGNHVEATNNELITVKYFQDITNTTDKIILEGDFINQTIDIGEYLNIDDWYFIGIIVDDNTSTLHIVIGKQSTNALLIDTNFAFIASTTYQKVNTNIAYICGQGGGAINCKIDLDDLIFEGNTDYYIDDIKSYFYLNAPTSGGNYDSAGINCLNFDEVLENYKEGQNNYSLDGNFISKIIKLSNNKFLGTGKLVISNEILFLQSIYDIQTRSAPDAENNSPTWSSWQNIDIYGEIQSPNNKYLQIRFSFNIIWFNYLSPNISKIEIIDYDTLPFPRKAFSMPVLYDRDTNKKDVVIGLNDCISVINKEELNGENYIEFTFPYTSNKRQNLTYESLVRLYDSMYTIRKISDNREGAKLTTVVYAEAGFYDLNYAQPIKEKEFQASTPDAIINYILSGTGWQLEETNIYLTRDFSIENNSNCLELLRNVQSLFGGDLIFNNELKKVSLFEDSSIDNGVIFSYDKNVRVNRIVESFDLINKLYVYGENGINISEHNNNLEYLYIENTGLSVDKCKVINNDNFTNTEELYKYAQYLVSKYNSPTISYEIEAKYLEYQNNQENLPNYNIGDIVTVYDKDLGITLQTRLVAMEYNVLNPSLSSLILSSQLRSLGDDLTEYMKYKNKFEALNFRVLILMVRTFLYGINRRFGFVLKRYIEVTGVIQTVNYGVVKMYNTSEYLSIFSSPDINSPQLTSIRHGRRVKIIGIYEEYYKIQLIEEE